MKLKRKAFNSCILPTLTYGAQTWALIKNIASKLRVTQTRMGQSILNLKISDKVKLQEIRRKIKIEDAIKKSSKMLKWKYAGHIIRSNRNRWPPILTKWTIASARQRGRPARRWEDEIKEVAGKC